MEIVRFWRIREYLLRLEVKSRETNRGIEINLPGSSNHFELPNLEKEKNMSEEIIIYQAIDSELVSAK